MKLKSRVTDGVLVLEVKGKVMGGPDAAAFQDVVKSEIGNGHKQFVFDLGGVDWMNSSGLGILIGGLTTIKNAGGQLKLANVTEKIQSLFMITKLVTIFDSHKTVEDALKAYQ
ncbi:anti-anti-sigma factor [candidate division LCP-89 bacterium B3_LCP]|uniref:Anti-sigma factor antagonist n=1 Tax=candidate division LCP-89 bacterium B3_LCP TaxID=2012998 RepID=A0A532V5D0_UNCL8|nr:MAG: anti-anti-sigma factor [candidate division LCP-89 bacterium B3_LCP]